MVFLYRGAGYLGHRSASGGADGIESAVRHPLSVFQRADQLFSAGWGVSLRHRRRGAVCRHGALWQKADLAGLVWYRLPQPAAELRRPGRVDPLRRRRHPKHLFPPVPADAADPSGDPGDLGHHYRQSGDHQRRLFHDSSGNPTGLVAAFAGETDH
ncbi:hypothetical protein D3C80_1231580 [compost metagenome]